MASEFKKFMKGTPVEKSYGVPAKMAALGELIGATNLAKERRCNARIRHRREVALIVDEARKTARAELVASLKLRAAFAPAYEGKPVDLSANVTLNRAMLADLLLTPEEIAAEVSAARPVRHGKAGTEWDSAPLAIEMTDAEFAAANAADDAAIAQAKSELANLQHTFANELEHIELLCEINRMAVSDCDASGHACNSPELREFLTYFKIEHGTAADKAAWFKPGEEPHLFANGDRLFISEKARNEHQNWERDERERQRGEFEARRAEEIRAMRRANNQEI